MQIVVMYHNSNLHRIKENQRYKLNENMELVAKHINQDNKLKKTAVFVLGSLMYCQTILAEEAKKTNLEKVDSAGNEILNIARGIGYWVCIIMCIVDIIKALMQGDTKSIAKIMMKYALAFAALYFFPWMLDIIKGIFV